MQIIATVVTEEDFKTQCNICNTKPVKFWKIKIPKAKRIRVSILLPFLLCILLVPHAGAIGALHPSLPPYDKASSFADYRCITVISYETKQVTEEYFDNFSLIYVNYSNDTINVENVLTFSIPYEKRFYNNTVTFSGSFDFFPVYNLSSFPFVSNAVYVIRNTTLSTPAGTFIVEQIDADYEGNSTNTYVEHYYISKSTGLLIEYFSNQSSGTGVSELDKQVLVKTNIRFTDVSFVRFLLIISANTTFIVAGSVLYVVRKSHRSRKIGDRNRLIKGDRH